MTKQEGKGKNRRSEPKNAQNPVRKSNKENPAQKKRLPPLTDDTRVVFSEEINRGSKMDDG